VLKIIMGNLDEEIAENPTRQGWFIGNFIDKSSVFNSNEFEVKWGHHKKGSVKKIPGETSSKSVSILISGKFIIRFPDNGKEVLLSSTGDYVFWDASISHTSEALEESILITIRWPSKK
jgi:hypothetical protein